MNKCNSFEATNKHLNSSDQTKFRLNEINKIKDYFNSKIQEIHCCFWLFWRSFNFFSEISRTKSIISFTNVIRVPVGIANESFSLVFSLTTGIIKKLLEITRNKKKKHNKIFMLAKVKLNSIEKLISSISRSWN